MHKHRTRTKTEVKSVIPSELGELIRGLSTLRLRDSADSEPIPVLRIDAQGPFVFLTSELYELFTHSGKHTNEPIQSEGTPEGHSSGLES